MTRTPTPIPAVTTLPVAAFQGTLALDLASHDDASAPPAPPGALAQTGRGDLERWVQVFAQAVVEVVGGDRPVSQLLRWTTGEVYQDLHRRALLVARAAGRTGGPLPGPSRIQQLRPSVRSVHTTLVTPRVAEASVHVRYGERGRAVAARFEQRRGRWLCTALEFA